MALSISYRPLDDLLPYDRNPRTHTSAQIKQIERSLSRFGWATPIGVADGVLIYGHARLTAAKGLRDKRVSIRDNDNPNLVPVVDLSHLSADERRAYVIADNQLAVTAGWDEGLLRVEMQELQKFGFDLTLTGFGLAEISEILACEEGDEPAGSLLGLVNITIAEPKHGVGRGDHWLLGGRHHLLCVSVVEGWPAWRPLLKGKSALFVPYPGPFVPHGKRAADATLVMVQPDRYVAGHLLDRYAEVKGEDAIKLVSAGEDAAAA